MSATATLKSKLPIKKADDLFDKSSMSFGSHLEELRKCLVYAMLWLAGGAGIGLFFATTVVNYVQTPLEEALAKYYANKTEKLVEQKGGGKLTQEFKDFLMANDYVASLVYTAPAEVLQIAPTVTEATGNSPNVPIEVATTNDQKGTAAGSNAIYDTHKYMAPVKSSLVPQWFIEKTPANTDALGLQEPFMIWLKAGLVVGIVIASPGIFYSLWSFVASGLYPHERKYVYFFLPCAVFLFLSGAALAFFVIFGIVIDFLLQFNDSLGIGASPRLTDYMSFALFLPIGFGVAFQLPLVMFVIERIGLISVETYLSQWRVAILAITVISMVLTPAEVTSMIGMGVPLVGLYYLGIALCKFFPRRGFQAEVGRDPT